MSKKFPTTLEIHVQKTKIIANRNIDGLNFLVGSNGKLIQKKKIKTDIPFLFGKFENKEFFKLKKMIDLSELNYEDVEKIYFFNSKRWDIKLKNGQLLKLPKEKLVEAIDLSIKLISKDEFKDIKIIDTRIINQVILNE